MVKEPSQVATPLTVIPELSYFLYDLYKETCGVAVWSMEYSKVLLPAMHTNHWAIKGRSRFNVDDVTLQYRHWALTTICLPLPLCTSPFNTELASALWSIGNYLRKWSPSIGQ